MVSHSTICILPSLVEGKKKEWRLIRAVLPSLAAPAVSLGVGGVDGVECLHSPARRLSMIDCVLLIDILYLHYRQLSSVFYNFFRASQRKCKNRKKVVDIYTDV